MRISIFFFLFQIKIPVWNERVFPTRRKPNRISKKLAKPTSPRPVIAWPTCTSRGSREPSRWEVHTFQDTGYKKYDTSIQDFHIATSSLRSLGLGIYGRPFSLKLIEWVILTFSLKGCKGRVSVSQGSISAIKNFYEKSWINLCRQFKQAHFHK